MYYRRWTVANGTALNTRRVTLRVTPKTPLRFDKKSTDSVWFLSSLTESPLLAGEPTSLRVVLDVDHRLEGSSVDLVVQRGTQTSPSWLEVTAALIEVLR